MSFLYPYSRKDAEQVLKAAFDDSTQRLRVDASISADPGSLEISAAAGDNIAISDGVDTLVVNPDGSINTNISGDLTLELTAQDDSVAIGDADTGNTMAVRPDGNATVVMSNQLITDPFDYIAALYPSPTVEVYTYRTGGPSGTITGVVTVTYTDSTKALISSVGKS